MYNQSIALGKGTIRIILNKPKQKIVYQYTSDFTNFIEPEELFKQLFGPGRDRY